MAHVLKDALTKEVFFTLLVHFNALCCTEHVQSKTTLLAIFDPACFSRLFRQHPWYVSSDLDVVHPLSCPVVQCLGTGRPSLSVHRLGNCAFRHSRTVLPQRVGAPSCWKISVGWRCSTWVTANSWSVSVCCCRCRRAPRAVPDLLITWCGFPKPNFVAFGCLILFRRTNQHTELFAVELPFLLLITWRMLYARDI
jgi:hypothetical protein